MYINQCAPKIAQSTMQAIIKTESNSNYLAIGINRGYKLKYQATTLKQAQAWVTYLETNNYNFDVGLGQINIKNIHKYGYKAIDALDPCTNLKIASDILQKNYVHARNQSVNNSTALQKAISAYNTGNYHAGFTNGYVQKVYTNANKPLMLANNKVPSLVNSGAKVLNATNEIVMVSIEPRRSKSVLYVRAKDAMAEFD